MNDGQWLIKSLINGQGVVDDHVCLRPCLEDDSHATQNGVDLTYIVVFAGKMVGGHRRCHLNTCHIVCSLIVHVWYLI